MRDPKLEAAIQKDVDAALEQQREERDRKIQQEIDECKECQEEGYAPDHG